MGGLLLGHAAAVVAHSHLHIVGGFLSADPHVAAAGRKLAGVVGEGVHHEERQRLVGFHDSSGRLHFEAEALELEAHARHRHDVEQLLQRETLDVERELSLSHLYPLRKQGVELVDFVGQFGHVVVLRLALLRVAFVLHQSVHLIGDAVDERTDAVDEMNLCPLLHVPATVGLQVESGQGYLLVHLFVFLLLKLQGLAVALVPLHERLQQVVGREPALAATAHETEGIEQCADDDNHQHHSREHDVQRLRGAVHLSGAGLDETVLARLLLQVEIDVAVVVALLFVVNGRIGERQLFADGSHEVGRPLYHRVALEGTVEIIDGVVVIFQFPVALGQRTVAARYLVDVAIAPENVE